MFSQDMHLKDKENLMKQLQCMIELFKSIQIILIHILIKVRP